MCTSSKRVAPPPPPPPPPPPNETASAQERGSGEATKVNDPVRRARRNAQTRARGLSGDRSTQRTGPRGLMAPANIATTTLLAKS